MKYLIEEATLTGIADAVREKKGTTDLIQVSNLATEISNIQGGGTVEELTITSNGTYDPPAGIDGYAPVVVNVPQDGAPTAEELTFTGSSKYLFANNNWNWFIKKYGNQIIIKADDLSYCFDGSNKLTSIPLVISANGTMAQNVNTSYIFRLCSKLIDLPRIENFILTNMTGMFYGCQSLKEIPEDYFNNVDMTSSSLRNNSLNSVLSYCHTLRKVPEVIIKAHYNHSDTLYWNSSLFAGLDALYCVDELLDLPPYQNLKESYAWTNNVFANFGWYCRVKNITFRVQEDSTPYTTKWSNQTINMSYCGYDGLGGVLRNYFVATDDIIKDKEVKDDTTYQALKDDPDYWTEDINYSRYNHDSAVRTINSLPDTSAYLTAHGGTNTIKFNGQSGASTDGGAINTLTEEEIAVATAKGWSVALV